MDSAEGNASESGPLNRTLCVEMPSTETSVWKDCPPCTEKLMVGDPLADGEVVPEAVSDCTPGSAWMAFSGLVPLLP